MHRSFSKTLTTEDSRMTLLQALKMAGKTRVSNVVVSLALLIQVY